MSRVRAVFVLTTLFLVTPLPGIVQMAAIRFKSRLAYKIPVVYHRFVCWLIDIRIECVGKPHEKGPCLIVANHSSWIDIVTLSALVPARFIARSDMAQWPIIGWLAKIQGSLFVERGRRTSTGKFKQEMQDRFAKSEVLVLFPEGTSSDGNRVLPFKSALFGAIKAGTDEHDSMDHVPIQPVSITVTKHHGIPLGRGKRPIFTWYGDMDIAPHIWQALCSGPCDVRVEFHEPVAAHQFKDRKQLALYSEECVRDGVLSALTGRLIKDRQIER